MKKTLRSILAGALALLTVSCYDDLALREDIANLGDDLKGLVERVEALEKTLNAEVGGINDLASRLENVNTLLAGKADAADVSGILTRLDAIDGETDGLIKDFEAAIAELVAADNNLDAKLVEAIAKISVVGVAEVDGKVELTLADGSKVALSKPLENVENTDLVTMVEGEDGEKYWAVVLADGTVQSLDLKVGAAEAVALEFRVAENNSLEYTLDGVDWVATGAYVANSEWSLLTDFYQGSVFDEDLWEEIVDDYYTLVFGGVEYQLPLYKVDNAVATIKAGKTYFEYGQTITFDVAIKELSSLYVMNKPDGWKAKLEGTTLTVTAPAEANVESGLADADGEVLLHGTTEEGKCKVARLAVATTAGFSLTIAEDGKLTIVNPEVVTTTDRWGNTNTDFNDVCIGLAPIATFEADPIAYVNGIQDNYSDKWYYINNWKNNTAEYDEGWNPIYTVGGAYVPGEYEVDIIETTVPEMYADWTYGKEMPVGSNFVVWACPIDDKGAPRIEDLAYVYFSSPIVATITAVEGGTTTSDIALNVNVVGATEYYVGLVTEEMLYGFPIDEYMQMSEGPFGYFQMALDYGMPDYAFQMMGTPFGGEFGEEMPETIMASYINYGSALMPESKVYMWVFPVVEGLALTDYTYEKNLKPYIYEFTTGALSAGGSESVEFAEVSKEFSNVTVEISATEGASMVYYRYYTADDFNAFASPADLTADLLKANAIVDLPYSVRAANDIDELAAGTTVFLAALAVDAEGKYGEAVSQKFETKSLVYSETFTAEFGEAVETPFADGYRYDIPVTINGGEAVKYYYVFSTTEYTEDALKNLPLSYNYNYDFKTNTSWPKESLVKGQYVPAGQTYYLSLVAESAEGEFSPVITKVITAPAAAVEE